MADRESTTNEVVTHTEEHGTMESLAVDEAPPTVSTDPVYDTRRQRIFDHRVEAQEDLNTMTACLAGVNSDLLDCELNIGETLRQELTVPGTSLEQIERHAGLIDLLLRLSKQIAQIAQLELRCRKESGEAASPKPH